MSVNIPFKGVQGWPIDLLSSQGIPALLCKTVQTWLRQANVMP